MRYPPELAKIVAFFESLTEEERRENLIAYAEQAKRHEPRTGEKFDFEDTRKDAECTDSVGVFLRVDRAGRGTFRIALGPQVQTLTRAMATILCKGLNGSRLEEIAGLPADFVERIVGSHLIRIRSQTVFHVLKRMKGACEDFLKTPHDP
ncbi:MAG: SufE family protein [Chthoniobacteraceae bacterium]